MIRLCSLSPVSISDIAAPGSGTPFDHHWIARGHLFLLAPFSVVVIFSHDPLLEPRLFFVTTWIQ